ncbi:uncharacterized protein CBL_21018 [Carabus blaptoides fortunei]
MRRTRPCGWGISNIGYVMICYGVTNGIPDVITGNVVKLIGRCPVVIFGILLHVVIWRPDNTDKYMYFLTADLWGIAHAVWLVQINAMSGILFPGKEEVSYSNFQLWEATGSVITYAYSPYLCTRLKLYILLGLLLVGVTGYTVIEYLEYKVRTVLGACREHAG